MIRFHTVVLSVAVSTLGYLAYLLWKRYRDDHDEPPPPRYPVASAAEQALVEIQIPCSAVGRIIGRQGANIKKLEQVSGARLHLDRDGGKRDNLAVGGATAARMRVLSIRGTAEAAQLAEVLVHRELAKEPDVVIEVLSVPQHSVRHIIGPLGKTIDAITGSTGARIKIGTRSSDMENAVEVTVSGEKPQVEEAKEKLLSVVKEATLLWAAEKTSRYGRHTSGDSISTTMLPANQQTGGAESPETHLSIRKLEWPNHEMYTAIFVSSCVSPAHFWVHVLELYGNLPQSVKALDELRALMTEFYSQTCRDGMTTDGQGSAEEPQCWMKGDVVAALFPIDGHWYRASVYEVLADGRLDVTYFDYGDSGVVQSCEALPLRSEFWQLPQQAIECYAADIEPAGEAWTEEALAFFEELVHVAKWKPLMARKVRSTHTETGQVVPCIVLIDTNSAEDISIANELVKKGFARKRMPGSTISPLTECS